MRRDAGERRFALLSLLLFLDLLPVGHLLVAGSDLLIAENMGMTADQLVSKRLQDVINGESPPLLGNGGMEERLQQQVSQFFAQMAVITFVDRLDHLVAFLDQVALQRVVGLLRIPRAAAGCRGGGA